MEHEARIERPPSVTVSEALNVLQSILTKRGVAISISGIDGSGKTTLAKALVHILESSDIPVRYLHIYSWYSNVGVTPFIILYNRYRRRKILVLDRCIYDNLAVLAQRWHCNFRILRFLARSISAFYPNFRYRFHLVATYSQTLLRRPDTQEKRFEEITLHYDQIMSCARYTTMRSDTGIIESLLHFIANEGRHG